MVKLLSEIVTLLSETKLVADFISAIEPSANFKDADAFKSIPVSYTHLTLPTKA